MCIVKLGDAVIWRARHRKDMQLAHPWNGSRKLTLSRRAANGSGDAWQFALRGVVWAREITRRSRLSKESICGRLVRTGGS